MLTPIRPITSTRGNRVAKGLGSQTAEETKKILFKFYFKIVMFGSSYTEICWISRRGLA